MHIERRKRCGKNTLEYVYLHYCSVPCTRMQLKTAVVKITQAHNIFIGLDSEFVYNGLVHKLSHYS